MNDCALTQQTGQAIRLWAKLRALKTFHGSHHRFALFTDDDGKPDIELVTDTNESRFLGSSNFIAFLNKNTQLVDLEELL